MQPDGRVGLGLHCYWQLREPCDLRESGAVARAASVLRRLCLHLGGDDRACDPARILRLPDTLNFKYDAPRPVRLVTETDATINLSELDAILPPEIVVRGELTLEGIPQGQRNDQLYRQGRSLFVQGRSLPEIYRELEALNAQWCRPPLDVAEVKKIAVHVTQQSHRPDFTPPTVIHDATPPTPVGRAPATFINLATVTPEAVTWVWPGRLAARKGVMLAGDPGRGKSMITTDLAARITTGRAWPDGGAAPKGRCLFLCCEDGLADTVRPRIEAHGGDAAGVEVLTAVQDPQGERLFNLSRDVAVLADGLRRFQPTLLVIDPLNAYLGKVDSYRDADVRGVLSPLLALLEQHACALVWVSHLTKNTEVKALYRPGASIGFMASARMALIVGEHPQQPGTLVLAQSKNNLAPTAPSLGFAIEDGRVCWGGVVDMTADAVLQIPDPEEVEAAGSADRLIAELRQDPAIWPLEIREAYAQAELLGIPERTVRRAARRAGLTAFRQGNGRSHKSFWFDVQHAAAHSGHSGHIPEVAGVAGVNQPNRVNSRRPGRRFPEETDND